MSKIEELFARYVRPSETDGVQEMLRRAEAGVRLTGAIIAGVVAAKSELPPGEAGTLLRWLERPRIGYWARSIRLAAARLDWAPLRHWPSLRKSGARDAKRSIDDWLSPMETSLRHSQALPPPELIADFSRAFREEISALCAEITRDTGGLEIEGEETETYLCGAGERIILSPLAQLAEGDLCLWDGLAGKKGSSWIRLSSTGGGEPVRRARREDRKLAPRTIGSLRALAERASGDPLEHFTGAPASASAGITVYVTGNRDAVEAAEDLALQLRSERRPAIVLPLDADEDATERLRELLSAGDGPQAVEQMKAWRARSTLHERPLILVAGRAVDSRAVDDLERMLAHTADVAIVTGAHTLEHRWSPELRRRADRRRIDRTESAPEAVLRYEELGMNRRDAWSTAAVDSFGLRDPASFDRFVAVITGQRDLLEAPEALSWWSRGQIVIAADGSAKPAGDGWRTLVAGLLGQARPESAAAHAGAYEAGAELRSRLAR